MRRPILPPTTLPPATLPPTTLSPTLRTQTLGLALRLTLGLALGLPILGVPTLGTSAALAQTPAQPPAQTAGQVSGTAAAPTQAKPPTLIPLVVARYPHAVDAYTEGLQYLGGGSYLESTGEEPGSSGSGVRRAELKTAKVLRQVVTPLNGAFGEGVTLLGGVAYHLTWQDGVAFGLSGDSLQEMSRYRYQGEGWGLTNDGKSLIMSNGSATLVWRDPKTFAVTRSITVTDGGQAITNLNELEYVPGTGSGNSAGSLYANIWLTDKIARIDPTTGKVTGWIDVSRLSREASTLADRRGHPFTFDDVANGIAYNPVRGTLLLTGKRWPTLFEVKLPGVRVDPSTTLKP